MNRLFPTICAIVVFAAVTAYGSEPLYSVRIGTASAVAGEAIEVEIRVDASTTDVAAIAFLVDYDETRLVLAEETAKNPRIQVNLPSEFISSIFYLSDNSGKIGIAIYDPIAPVANLAEPVIARLRFRIRSEASGFATVALDAISPPSAADRAGNGVTGSFTTAAGGIAITARRAALVVSPRELSFGSTDADRVAERLVIVANAGNAPLTIDSINLERADSGFQLVPPALPFVLAEGFSVPIAIRFQSSEYASFRERLVVRGVGSEPVIIELSASTLPDGTFAYETKKVVPAVASATGGEKTSWRSSLTLYNSLEQPAAARVTFTKNDGERTAPVDLIVAAGESKSYSDVVGALFGQSNTIGSLLVETSSPDLIVRSATYSVRADGGTSAQSVPAVDWHQLFRGEPAYLTALERSSAKRTNIGILSMSNELVMMRITIVRGDGETIGSRDYAIRPGELIASADIFDVLGLTTADNLTAIIAPLSPNAVFYAYASTVDNRTAAPLFQSPR